ncbi:DUF397 domain-containing protein [Streptomyces sp. NPDC052012]|uniref:DUF397 domain-containing protein n=1 Tax=Streptomyces sp. NPDC052012 TaxID=3155051 RepID=UPI00344C5C5F
MRNGPGSSEASPAWFKSSYSNGAGGECVECATEGARIILRDSKIGDELIASVGAPAWRSFTHAMHRGWPEAP